MTTKSYKLLLAASALVGFAFMNAGYAQTAPAAKPAAPTTPAEKTASPAAATADAPLVLSPFTVTTEKDKGYRATNSSSGTRLDAEIKDLPMPIEVITEEFIRDTGARDLRQSLRYSAGIQLQTQNDWGSQLTWGNSSTPGRINNPEGLTSTADQTHVKIRGFQTEATLRDGFRRQNSTDSVNISRVEVIRGPSALLYGVGNFGGVVNYLVKQPTEKAGGAYSAVIGSYSFKRATLDYNVGKIGDTVMLRVNAAAQDTKDYTQYNKENHYFVAPIVVWKPFANTEIMVDMEYGKQNRGGIGFQNLRAVPNAYVNDGAGYDGSFLQSPGIDNKTFRWSGPDTYNDSLANNLELKLTQKITDNLNFSVGYNRSNFSYDQRDVAASLQTVSSGSSVPTWAQGTITYNPLVQGQLGFPIGPQNSTIGYQWAQSHESDRHEQVRTDLVYTLKLFDDSKWFKLANTFLVGTNYTREVHANDLFDTAYDRNNNHSPTDFKPIRWGTQGDGQPDAIMVPYQFIKDTTQDSAIYAVYQGKMLDDRLTVIAGVRKEKSWNVDKQYNPQWNAAYTGHNGNGPSTLGWVTVNGDPSKDTTKQLGASFRLTKNGSLSLFVMSAEAISPNYQGAKDFNLVPLKASLGKDKEIGLKFDLLDGRISGTVSKFRIDRSRVGIGSIGAIWWAPTTSAENKYDPAKDIIYEVNDMNPRGGTAGWVPTLSAVTAQWDAAVAAGAIYQAKNSAGNTNWYVNGTKATGASYLDALFAATVANKAGYHGWMYGSDSLTNNASMDAQNNHGQQSVPLGADRSSGWDMQMLFAPINNLQIAVSFSHIDKVVVHASQWIKYPNTQDRWAIWLSPGWPMIAPGKTAKDYYADVKDTSTNVAFGDGLPLDDTPKNAGSVWVHYEMPKTSGLHGLNFGLGAQYQGEGALYPIFSRQQYDKDGNQIFLNTQTKTTYSGMVRYEFKVGRHDASLQLNVDNLVNDTKYYGFIAQAPRKMTLTYDQKF